MLKHVVIWKVKDPAQRDAHAAAVRQALEGLRGRIPGLLAIEVGTDIGCDKSGQDVVLYSEFADRAALDAYQDHPLHQDAKNVIGPLLTNRVAIDWIV
jgi:quinol monooxygenase YgiN